MNYHFTNSMYFTISFLFYVAPSEGITVFSLNKCNARSLKLGQQFIHINVCSMLDNIKADVVLR